MEQLGHISDQHCSSSVVLTPTMFYNISLNYRYVLMLLYSCSFHLEFLLLFYLLD